MNRHARHVLIALVAIIVLALTWLWGNSLGRDSDPRDDAGVSSPRLTPREELPALARQTLQHRMQRHAEDTAALLTSVLALDYESAARDATRIIEEPRLARPLAGDETLLNEALPERFFTLQDALTARAEELRGAAERRDTAALAQSFGNITATCVECHAVYAGGPRRRAP